MSKSQHDHASCRHAALEGAQRLAETRGVKLTDTRARVLDIIAESHKPIGAYDILQRLAGERGRTAPPTVYRALAFLTEQGFIHRIDSLNAFVACFDPEREHDAGFLICERCKTVDEVSDSALEAAVGRAVAARGFAPRRAIVEISGMCAACGRADKAAAA